MRAQLARPLGHRGGGLLRLGAAVDRAKAGGGPVSLVGHSVGGLSARYYLKALGGAPKVTHYAAIGTAQSVSAKRVRAAIDSVDEAGDADSADLLTAASRQADKDLWFIEAHRG